MITICGKPVPTELGELVDPAHTAVVVIDMQNDFCSIGGASDCGGTTLEMYQAIIPKIAEVINAARTRGVPVLHVRMLALPDGRSDSPAWIRLRMRADRSDHAQSGVFTFTVDGTAGAAFVSRLQPLEDEPVITKYRSSAFYGTDLEIILRSSGVRTLVVTGCTTEGCVESTVRDAGIRDYFTVLLSDCVGSDDRGLHESSMHVMAAYRTDVATSSELIDAWGAPSEASGADS